MNRFLNCDILRRTNFDKNANFATLDVSNLFFVVDKIAFSSYNVISNQNVNFKIIDNVKFAFKDSTNLSFFLICFNKIKSLNYVFVRSILESFKLAYHYKSDHNTYNNV